MRKIRFGLEPKTKKNKERNETMNSTTSIPAKPQPCQPFFRPKFALYHASAKGNGGAIKMALHPAHDDVAGSIWITLANQVTIGDRRGPNPVYPRFDWDGSITVKLDFDDLCQMLQVFRGEIESINEGKGLYHVSTLGTTRIVFRHLIDPVCGYALEVYRTPRNGGEDQRAYFLFSAAEAAGICEAIADSMGVIAFGIPIVQAHDTSAYEAKVKGVRNAVAA